MSDCEESVMMDIDSIDTTIFEWLYITNLLYFKLKYY